MAVTPLPMPDQGLICMDLFPCLPANMGAAVIGDAMLSLRGET
jgi:hypothetical protein